jgi:aryl-alcohol dehydrogenase-like predicted oxidoreductase
LLQHAPNTLLIPGTANFDHLAENLAVGSLHLDEPTMATLDTLHPVAS